MTRKHFNALAAALAASRPDGAGYEWAQWRADVSAISRVCSQFNDSFDAARFLDACNQEV